MVKGKQTERKITEKHLIDQARKNPALFAPLYEKYFRAIFIFIFKRIQEEDTTGDITQRVFLKAMLNLDKYEDRGFPFSSWLYRIASNEVNMYFRKQKKTKEVELVEGDVKSLLNEVSSNSKSDYSLLIEALNQLSLDDSTLIELRFFEKRSFKEIGQIIGISEPNAKMKVYRILKKMRKLMGEKE